MSDDVVPPVRRVFRALGSQNLWGIIAIVCLLAINLIKDPSYLNITYSSNTGAFVGNLVDILRASAPILMIAVGMCLVIATSGIDLSVGSLMAVSGAVSMEYLRSANAPDSVGAHLLARSGPGHRPHKDQYR